MRFTILFISTINLTGLLFNPVFVHAGSSCYVDEGASSGGDGSKDNPYASISKSLDKGCKDMIVKKGSYSDNITLGGDVELEGEDKSDVVITGKITMKDGSEIKKVTIKGGGIYVSNNSDATVIDVTIKDAPIGIETSGSGKLTVSDSNISGNGKGFYLQAGKNVSIKSSSVSNNTEEGIDIRSNVDGIISGNTIEDNGEGGIEVVLGKSDLTISGNKIKNNGSSGIATQFYDLASELGGVKINNNTISGNKDFAITCKVPSGGSLSAGYWSKSISFIGNNISGNKDGDFAPNCNFSNLEMTNATKTEEELEAEKKAKEEALAKYKAPPGEVIGKIKILETTSGELNLREGPSIGYVILGTVKSGEEYDYSILENNWYKITVDDDLWGWVSGYFVEKASEEEEEIVIVNEKEDEVNNILETEAEDEVNNILETEAKDDVILETQTQNDNKSGLDNKVIFGALIVALVSFLILLFLLLSNKLLRKKKKTVISIENRRDGDINNF